MRRIWFAIIVAFAIQLPFLILTNFIGVHSPLGSVWVVFYLPVIWLLDLARVPGISPFPDILVFALVQEIILLVLILSLTALWVRVKAVRTKASRGQ